MHSGLTKIGINQTTLPPGKESSMRHWHTHEEEFIYVLSGEVVLRTDAGEQMLTAGHVRGLSARRRQDRRRTSAGQSQQPSPRCTWRSAIATRRTAPSIPDVDLQFHGASAAVMFTRKDGSRF